ncbi:MAG: hypothetical protein MI919_16215 [Holophagales bacterium]|nr:hypothetical protein [Holophagales bacterium]
MLQKANEVEQWPMQSLFAVQERQYGPGFTPISMKAGRRGHWSEADVPCEQVASRVTAAAGAIPASGFTVDAPAGRRARLSRRTEPRVRRIVFFIVRLLESKSSGLGAATIADTTRMGWSVPQSR